jgi:hypothetical protein
MRKLVGTARGRTHARRAGTVLAAVAALGLLTASAVDGTPAYGTGGVIAAGPGAAAPRPAAATTAGATVNCGGITVGAADRGRPVPESERSGPAEAIAQVLRLAEWNRRSPYDRAAWSVVPVTEDTAMLIARLPGRTTYVPAYERPDGHWQMGAPCPT